MKEYHIAKTKNHWKMPCRQFLTKQKRISQNNLHGKRRNPAWFFLLPSLIGTGIFVVIPFGDVVRRSFAEAFTGKFVGVGNYKTVFANEAFQLAMGNTLKFTGICIPLLLVVSLFLAVAIEKMGRKKRIFQGAFLVPMAVPVASVVLFWKLAFGRNGYLNGITVVFGADPVDWMNGETAFAVLIFAYLWKNTGYFIVLWLAGLGAVPESYYEAARVDGANEWECFWYITVPQLVPTFFMVIILAFVNSFKVFREAYLIAGDYPHESIYMLQHLFNNWFANLDVQKMSTAAVLLAAGISLFIYGLLKLEHKVGSEE